MPQCSQEMVVLIDAIAPLVVGFPTAKLPRGYTINGRATFGVFNEGDVIVGIELLQLMSQREFDAKTI